MRDNLRTGYVVLVLAFLALGLSWALWGQGSARAARPSEFLFQSEIPTETPTATFEPSPTLAPSGLTATPTSALSPTTQPTDTSGPQALPTTAEPFVQQTATPVFTPPLPVESATATGPAPTAPGYLPPPTLTFQQPTPTPQADGPTPAPEPASPPETTSGPGNPPGMNRAGLARLIDTGVVLFSYAWLCCGALTLAGAGLLLFWLMRRGRPTQSPPG